MKASAFQPRSGATSLAGGLADGVMMAAGRTLLSRIQSRQSMAAYPEHDGVYRLCVTTLQHSDCVHEKTHSSVYAFACVTQVG